ncbi:hypothetical protein ABH920_010082, partial [Catenulispora sp. EB89]|uniref:LamG domain-containing protein n=1 Tax=Catenulispora sp. EB89 TaxID=3156257 RepID=UPI0035141E92
PSTLPSNGVFDGYAATCCTSQYVPLGGRHLTVGNHKLTVTVTGQNAQSGGYGMGIDFFEVSPFANVTADSFAHSLNNHGISDDTAPNSANIDLIHPADIGTVGTTGTGDSLSLQALAKAGLAPSTNLTLDGVNFSIPAANGTNDNTIAMGQTITLDKSQQIRANAVAFLVAAVNGGTPGDSPQRRITTTISYSAGGATDVKPMPAVADWCTGPSASAAYVLPYRNASTGTNDTSCPVRIYMVVVPVHPQSPLQSVSLPYYGTDVTPGTHDQALHVLAIGVRPAAAANLPASADASGNNHPVTLNGRVGFDNAGKNGAAVFDGSGGNAATKGNVLDSTQSFSISAWVNAANLGTTHQVAVVQQGANVGALYLQYSGSTWEFTREDADINGSTGQSAFSNSPATTGWTHLVGTWDSTSGTMILYVNGVAQNATVVEHNAMPSTGPLV